MNPNPLNQYFRHPVLHVSLPSQGKFYPKNSIDLTQDNQYPVLPLTRQDELVFMTATGQINGSSIVSIIQSCIPNIKNAWKMPVIDIDKILVAIKIATHGTQLDVVSTCPNCEHSNQMLVDLQSVIDQIPAPDYSAPVEIEDLRVYFKPISYQQLTDNNKIQFNEEDIVSMLQDSTIDEHVKSDKIEKLLEKVRALATTVLCQNIQRVETPTAKVEEPEHISEWLNNCDRTVYMQLQDSIVKYKVDTEIKPADVTCTNCATSYQHVYNLDISNNE